MVPSLKHLTLDLSSGLDLGVDMEPGVGFHTGEKLEVCKGEGH